MEWLVGVALAIMVGICALSMLRMMLRGWRGAGRHGGHGMMCMGHSAEREPRTSDKGLLEELRAERERLDVLIARAGRGSAGQAG